LKNRNPITIERWRRDADWLKTRFCNNMKNNTRGN
jgi:hypothetical protein